MSIIIDLIFSGIFGASAFAIAAFPILGASLLIVSSTLETAVISFGSWQGALVDGALALYLAGCALRLILVRKKEIGSFFYPLAAIVFTGFLSVLFCLNPLSAAWSAFRITSYAAAAYFFSVTINRQSKAGWILALLFLSAIISALLSIMQWVRADDPSLIHVSGGFSDWNFYPIFLASLSPFWIYQALRFKHTAGETLFLIFFYLMLLLALGVGSRSGTAIVVFAYLWMAGAGPLKKKHMTWLLPIVLVGVAHLSYNGWFTSVPWSKRAADWIASPRMQERAVSGLTALRVATGRPLFGAGVGQFDEYIEWANPDLSYLGSSTQSSILLIPAETGLLGLFAYVFLIVSLFSISKKRDVENEEQLQLKSTTIKASISIVIAASLICVIHTHLYIWLLLGFLYAMDHAGIQPVKNNNNSNL